MIQAWWNTWDTYYGQVSVETRRFGQGQLSLHHAIDFAISSTLR